MTQPFTTEKQVIVGYPMCRGGSGTLANRGFWRWLLSWELGDRAEDALYWENASQQRGYDRIRTIRERPYWHGKRTA